MPATLETINVQSDWIVDECPDAHGNLTIRVADGSPNGNTELEPIATVFDPANAPLVALSPLFRDTLERVLDDIDDFYEKQSDTKDEFCGTTEAVRAALALLNNKLGTPKNEKSTNGDHGSLSGGESSDRLKVPGGTARHGVTAAMIEIIRLLSERENDDPLVADAVKLLPQLGLV